MVIITILINNKGIMIITIQWNNNNNNKDNNNNIDDNGILQLKRLRVTGLNLAQPTVD